RNFSAQHAFARVAAEIDLDERARDARKRDTLDGERKQGNESSQRIEIRLVKAVGARCCPRRVDAVHLADDAGGAEAMNEDQVVGLPLSFHLAKDCEVFQLARAEPAPKLAASGRD